MRTKKNTTINYLNVVFPTFGRQSLGNWFSTLVEYVTMLFLVFKLVRLSARINSFAEIISFLVLIQSDGEGKIHRLSIVI